MCIVSHFVFLFLDPQGQIRLFNAFRAPTANGQLNRFSFEIRKLGSSFKNVRRKSQFQVDYGSALVADRVVVPGEVAVITVGVHAELDLADETLGLQIAQGIVDSRERDAGQDGTCFGKYIVCGQMLFRILYDLKDTLSLFRKSRTLDISVGVLHNISFCF
jgi:hypothetical protein